MHSNGVWLFWAMDTVGRTRGALPYGNPVLLLVCMAIIFNPLLQRLKAPLKCYVHFQNAINMSFSMMLALSGPKKGFMGVLMGVGG